MKHVFTDERFPGTEVIVEKRTDGTAWVSVRAIREGVHTEVEKFRTDAADKDSAARRASYYFQSLDEMLLTESDYDLPGDPDRDHTEFFNNPIPTRMNADDLVKQHDVMTADDVLDAYERAKAIQDPQQRAAALDQVKSMAQQMESSAEELVRRLLS